MQNQSRPSRRTQWAATFAATLASTYAMDVFATAAGIAVVASGILRECTPGQVLFFLLLSYFAWAGGLRANLPMNARLLAETGISASLLSKIAYETVAIRTHSIRAQRLAAAAGYVATEFLKEAPYYIGAISAALVSDAVATTEVMLFLGGANFGAAAYELALARSTRSVLIRLPAASSARPRAPSTASFDRDWAPRQYLREYYVKVCPDEENTVAFFADQIKSCATDEPILIAGVGPTLHHVFLAAERASEIHLAEYLPGNFKEIRNWLSDEPSAHDWTDFVRYTLMCEGVPPTADACHRRVALTRAKISHLLPFDLRQEWPLGSAVTYSTVISAFCADSATDDIQEWSIFMDRIASLVRPGGTLMIAALHNASSYRIGKLNFPSAKVSDLDLRSQMLRAFPRENVTVDVCSVPDCGRGYSGILLARGRGRL